MNNSAVISKDIAIKFYKLSKYIGELFSNEFEDCNKNGCIIVTKDDFKTLSTGVTTKIYEDQNKRISHSNKKCVLYTISAVEDAITRAVRLGGISLDDSILIVSSFPCLYSLKMILQSGITTIVTINYTNNYSSQELECLNILLESLNVILLQYPLHNSVSKY